MPKKVYRDPRKIVEAMAQHWGLSFEGATWHAKNCGVLNSEQADTLASQTHAPWMDLSEFEASPSLIPPEMFNPDLPKHAAGPWDGMAAKVVLDAFEEDHITLGRARELLTWG